MHIFYKIIVSLILCNLQAVRNVRDTLAEMRNNVQQIEDRQAQEKIEREKREAQERAKRRGGWSKKPEDRKKPPIEDITTADDPNILNNKPTSKDNNFLEAEAIAAKGKASEGTTRGFKLSSLAPVKTPDQRSSEDASINAAQVLKNLSQKDKVAEIKQKYKDLAPINVRREKLEQAESAVEKLRAVAEQYGKNAAAVKNMVKQGRRLNNVAVKANELDAVGGGEMTRVTNLTTGKSATVSKLSIAVTASDGLFERIKNALFRSKTKRTK
jgi:hypothetical protein